MDSKKDIGVVGTIVAVIVAVVGVSVVWAAYTSNLTVKGSASAEAANWSIIFKDLGTAQVGNTAGVTSTAKEVTAPTIVGDTSIEDYEVSVKTPGDFVSYTFKIKNDGSFPAKIDDGFSIPTPTCEVGGATTTDSTNVCAQLTYTLEYTSGGSVASGDEFAIGEEKEVILKLAYTVDATDTTGAKLPKTNVDIKIPDITIPFVQQ